MKARQLVKRGLVGDIISVDVGTLVRRDNYMCLNRNHWCHKLPGGIFFEILPHPVYLLQEFMDDAKISNVLAKKLNDYDWMRKDELRVQVEGQDKIGSILASCNSPFHGDSLDIFGTKQALRVDLWGRSIIKYKPRTEAPVSVGKANLSLASQSLSLVGANISNLARTITGGVKISAHYGFILDFVRRILADKDMLISADQAKENVRIVSDICEKIDAS
jgi:predicted dehydrogenase